MLAKDYTDLCNTYFEGKTLQPLPDYVSRPWVVWSQKATLELLIGALFDDWRTLSTIQRINRIRSINRSIRLHLDKHVKYQALNQAIITKFGLSTSDWQRAMLCHDGVDFQHRILNKTVKYHADIASPIKHQHDHCEFQQTPSSYAVIGSYMLKPIEVDGDPVVSRQLPMAVIIGRLDNDVRDFVTVYLKAAEAVTDEHLATVSRVFADAATDMFSFMCAFRNCHDFEDHFKDITSFVLNDIVAALPEPLKQLNIDFVFSRSMTLKNKPVILTASLGDMLCCAFDIKTHRLMNFSKSRIMTHHGQRIAPLIYDKHCFETSKTTDFHRIATQRFVLLPGLITQNTLLVDKCHETLADGQITRDDGNLDVQLRTRSFEAFTVPDIVFDDRYTPRRVLLDSLLYNATQELEVKRDSAADYVGDDLFSVTFCPPDTLKEVVLGASNSFVQ